MAKSPFANYGDFFDVEYRVNGVWNMILHQFFQPGYKSGEYVVCAETYPIPTATQGLMMDLTVNKLVQTEVSKMEIAYAYLCYEGKGANGDPWEKLKEQLEKWFGKVEDHDEGGVKFKSWAIGTRGKMTRFYCYDTEFKREDKLVTQEISDKTGQLVESTQPEREYDITEGKDWDKIVLAMRWLAANKP